VSTLSHVTNGGIVVEFLHFLLFCAQQLVDLLLDFLLGRHQFLLGFFLAFHELLKLVVHAYAKLFIHNVENLFSGSSVALQPN
jgi:hypothetical protein